MAIRLICDLCDTTIEYVNDVIMALPHWLIVRNKENLLDERHFCRNCKAPHEVEAARRFREAELEMKEIVAKPVERDMLDLDVTAPGIEIKPDE